MNNIFLIGFMGCGKSAVAQGMSDYYEMDIVEMDEEIVRREERTIPEIFETKGEAYFREVETELLREIQSQENKIVSCGGGVATREQNVAIMKGSGKVVLLTAMPETILERVKNDDNRPLLKGKKNVEAIREFLELRYPKYKSAADLEVETDGKSIKTICDEIMKKIS